MYHNQMYGTNAKFFGGLTIFGAIFGVLQEVSYLLDAEPQVYSYKLSFLKCS